MHRIFLRQNQVRLASSSQASSYRSSISASRLNHIAKILKPQRYLEIGVARGQTLESIDVEYRIGVDPAPLFSMHDLPEKMQFFKMDSDEFFNRYVSEPFQLIFLDGLHEARQTYRDVLNALNNLDERGFILLDDVWPTDYASSLPSIKESNREKITAGISHRRWYGDVYKVVTALYYFYSELNIQIIGDSVDSHSQALIWSSKTSGNIESLSSVIEFMESIDYKSTFGQDILRNPWANAVHDETFYKDFFKWVQGS